MPQVELNLVPALIQSHWHSTWRNLPTVAGLENLCLLHNRRKPLSLDCDKVALGCHEKTEQYPYSIPPTGKKTDERLDTGGALVVGSAEPPADVLVVEDLHLEGEIPIFLMNSR